MVTSFFMEDCHALQTGANVNIMQTLRNSNASRWIGVSTLGLLVMAACSLSSVTNVSADDAEPTVVKVDSDSYIVVRNLFKQGTRTEWTIYELATPSSLKATSSTDFSMDGRMRRIRGEFENLKNVARYDDARTVVIPATGGEVTNDDDLKGKMDTICVWKGDSCNRYAIQGELTIKVTRQHKWTTFE